MLKKQNRLKKQAFTMTKDNLKFLDICSVVKKANTNHISNIHLHLRLGKTYFTCICSPA